VKKEGSYFFIPPYFLPNHRDSKETRKQDGTDSEKERTAERKGRNNK